MINYYILRIDDKNINSFIKYLYKNKINIIDLSKKNNCYYMKVTYDDYKLIKNLRTSIKINVIKIKGVKKAKIIINKYKIFISFFVLGIILIILFSNIIFKINIKLENNNLKEKIIMELKNNGIEKFTYKKSYDQLSKIKEKIKTKYQNEIEWLEIKRIGVIYNIEVIERKTLTKKNNTKITNIVADKDGYILSITSRNGEVVKQLNDYVKKGDIIISGIIHRNEEIVNYVESSGTIYAETWYKVSISHPLEKEKIKYSGKNKTSYEISILGRKLNFNFLHKNYKITSSKAIFDNRIIKINKNKISKFIITKKKYTYDDLISICSKIATSKIKNKLDSDEEILSQKKLKIVKENDKLYIEIFFKVKEKIGVSKEIVKEENVYDR